MSKPAQDVLAAVRTVAAIPPEVVRELKRSEGFRAKPYKDSLGKLTIGYGTLLEGKGLSREESEVLLLMRAMEKRVRLDDQLARRGIDYRALPPPARRSLLRLAYQIGVARLLRFKRMLAAVKDRRWRTAHAEALDSKWAKRDSPARARRVAKGFLDCLQAPSRPPGTPLRPGALSHCRTRGSSLSG